MHHPNAGRWRARCRSIAMLDFLDSRAGETGRPADSGPRFSAAGSGHRNALEIPATAIMQIGASSCPLCHGARVRAFNAVAHDMPAGAPLLSVHECTACGLAWQFPRMRTDAESIAAQSHSYQEGTKDTYYDPERRRTIVAMEMGFLETFFDAPGSLLDVGAGDGTFIACAAARGWHCVGIDPAARPRSDFDSPANGGKCALICGTLQDLDQDARFDVLTLWDVIEHVDDPHGVLEAAIPLLKPTGVLIIETGNFQSVERVTGGPDWWCYAADHRWYFSPPTVRALADRCGMKHTAFSTRVLRPWWRGSNAFASPSYLQVLKKVIRAPHMAARAYDDFRTLRANASAWSDWGGLGIVAIAASRVPLEAKNTRCALLPLTRPT